MFFEDVSIVTVATTGTSETSLFMNVGLKLSVLKPIHAIWLVEMSQYNFFTSAEGMVHVLKGWEKAGKKGVLSGREVLPPLYYCQ